MDPFLGTATIWLALFLGGGSIVLLFDQLRKTNPKHLRLSGYLALGAFGALTAALLYLVYLYVSHDFDVHDVWALTDRSLPIRYRISAIWSGMNGSMFVWGYVIALTLAVNEGAIALWNRNAARRGKDPILERTRLYTRLVVSSLSLLFVVMMLINDPFTTTHSFTATDEFGNDVMIDPSFYPDGHGLKPVLQNPWMMIHPPIVFMAYAGIVLSFGAVFSSFINRGDGDEWLRISRPWSRIAFLLLTIGIGLGAIWAYTVVSWGGYWSWDPKETSALMVWMALGLFIFAQENISKRTVYRKLTPLFGVISFSLMLFGTFITRSGLWSTVPIYMKSASTFILVAVMLLVLGIGLLSIMKGKAHEGEGDVGNGSPENDLDMTLIGTISFVMIILLSILLRSMDRPFAPDYYETVILLPLVVILVLVGHRSIKDKIPKNLIVATAAGSVAFATLAAFVAPGVLGGDEGRVFFIVPRTSALAVILVLALLVVVSSSYALFRSFNALTGRGRTSAIGRTLALIGILSILIGYGSNSVLGNTHDITLTLGQKVHFGDGTVEWTNITSDDGNGSIGYLFKIRFTEHDGSSFEETTGWRYYTERGDIVVSPGIRTGLSDVLVSLTDLDPDRNGSIDEIEVRIKELPLVGAVWTGYAMMIAGILAWSISSTPTVPMAGAEAEVPKRRVKDIRPQERAGGRRT